MKTFATFLFFVGLLAGSISAQQSVTVTHLYTRAELHALPKDQLVEIAYSLQRRVLIDEAQPSKMRAVLLPKVLGTQPPATEQTHRRSPLLTIIGAVAAGLLINGAMSREQSMYAGTPVTFTTRQVATSRLRGRPLALTTSVVSTPGPNPQGETCRYLGVTSTAAQAATTIWGNNITSNSTQFWVDSGNEAFSLAQAIFGCNLPGPTSVTQGTTTSAVGFSPYHSQGRPEQATTTTSITVAPSVRTKQCAAYSQLGTFFSGSSKNWSRWPKLPIHSVAPSPDPTATYDPRMSDDDYYVRYTLVFKDANGNIDESPAGVEYHVRVRKNQALEIDQPIIPEGSGANGWRVYIAKGRAQEDHETLQGVNDKQMFSLDTKDWTLEKAPDTTTDGWPSATQSRSATQDPSATQNANTTSRLQAPPSPAPPQFGFQMGSFLSTIAKGIRAGWCNNINSNIMPNP
jgi:hypothetical protein